MILSVYIGEYDMQHGYGVQKIGFTTAPKL